MFARLQVEHATGVVLKGGSTPLDRNWDVRAGELFRDSGARTQERKRLIKGVFQQQSPAYRTAAVGLSTMRLGGCGDRSDVAEQMTNRTGRGGAGPRPDCS